jgi:uncharacterized membrane protein
VKSAGKIVGSLFVFVLFLIMTQIAEVLTKVYKPNVQDMAVSFSWAVFSVVSVLYGVWKKVKAFRLLGIGLLFLTLAKLIVVDLPTLSVLMRAALFSFLGVIGILLSRMFYIKEKRQK